MKCQKVKKESLVVNRQQEIIRACEELYETMEYEDTTARYGARPLQATEVSREDWNQPRY